MRQIHAGNRSRCSATALNTFRRSRSDAAARAEIYLECYIFAADDTGLAIAEALCRRPPRGVAVHVMVDGWGAKNFLSPT
jgi:phosphatidylserine/phosphatidylglycerophosphate/cardiolipin synthase-like enzyme